MPMASCYQCGRLILFGGIKEGDHRFCKPLCRQHSHVERTLGQYAPEAVAEAVQQVHLGACPRCQGPGPVDAHAAHQVWSAILLTRWTTSATLSCRKCGTKRQAQAMLFSLALGWWGFPWGLIVTPVQLTRNLMGIFRKPARSGPSSLGVRQIRYMLARHWASDGS